MTNKDVMVYREKATVSSNEKGLYDSEGNKVAQVFLEPTGFKIKWLADNRADFVTTVSARVWLREFSVR